MSPHGLMWSSMYRPDKPEVRRRVDWKRIGALFAPYWRQQATVMLCIVVASTIGLAPGFITARIIDSAIPNRDVRALATDVCLVLAAAFVAAAIGIAFISSKALDFAWVKLQNYQPSIGEPRDEIVMPLSGAIGAGAALSTLPWVGVLMACGAFGLTLLSASLDRRAWAARSNRHTHSRCRRLASS